MDFFLFFTVWPWEVSGRSVRMIFQLVPVRFITFLKKILLECKRSPTPSGPCFERVEKQIALRARPPNMLFWTSDSQPWTSLKFKACSDFSILRKNSARRFFGFGISSKISNFHLSILKSVLARINGKQHPGRYPTKNIEHTIVQFPFVYANKHTILCSFRLTFMCAFLLCEPPQKSPFPSGMYVQVL